jgi:outer membrane protein
MKNLLKSFVILALLMSAGTVMAQQKIGHINSGALLQAMPEVKTADEAFEAFRVSKIGELEAMEKERQAKIVTYQDKYKTLSEANKETLGQELETLGQDIQTMSERIGELDQRAQEELAKKREELYQPILAKAETAVQAVAKAEGFSYVFDTQNQALVYFEGGIDITPLVKTKLGIK